MPTQNQSQSTETDRCPTQQGNVREIPVLHRRRCEEVIVFRVIGEPRRARTSSERSYRFVAQGGRRVPA